MKSEVNSRLQYDQSFFDAQEPGVTRSAHTVVPIIMGVFGPRSVLDVGCGAGLWLREFLTAGVGKVVGVDGDYVDRNKLAIPVDSFLTRDLSDGPFDLGNFDLAMCLEVAEHLPGDVSIALVQSLVNSSDVVLFSAAMPGQVGLNHINEQWPNYWQERFSRHGYEPLNLIQPRIRDNRNVEWWYRQNLLLFASQRALADHPEWNCFRSVDGLSPIEWVHFNIAAREETFRSLWKKFRRVVGLSLSEKWPRLFRFIVTLKK